MPRYLTLSSTHLFGVGIYAFRKSTDAHASLELIDVFGIGDEGVDICSFVYLVMQNV